MCFASQKPSKIEFFVPARTDLVVKLLQAKRGFAAGAVLFDLGGNGAFWKKRV